MNEDGEKVGCNCWHLRFWINVTSSLLDEIDKHVAATEQVSSDRFESEQIS